MDLSNNQCLVPVNGGPDNNIFLGNVATFGCIPVLVSELIDAAFFFAGFVAVIFIIWSGIRLIMSGGDAEKVKSSRRTMTFAIIGLILVFFSFALVTILGFITGATCISQFTSWNFTVCSGK